MNKREVPTRTVDEAKYNRVRSALINGQISTDDLSDEADKDARIVEFLDYLTGRFIVRIGDIGLTHKQYLEGRRKYHRQKAEALIAEKVEGDTVARSLIRHNSEKIAHALEKAV